MNWLVENWYLIIIAVAIISCVAVGLIDFFKLPTETQKRNVKAFLLKAVCEAEKKFGSDAGELKLLEVYDMVLDKFPWVGKFIEFEEFKSWVDEALKWMNDKLKNNDAIAQYIKGEK